MTPRLQVSSVGYAVTAGKLENSVFVSGGNVGVGTATPNQKLTIEDSTGDGGYVLGTKNTGVNGDAIHVQGANGTTSMVLRNNGNGGGDFQLYEHPSTGMVSTVLLTASGGGTLVLKSNGSDGTAVTDKIYLTANGTSIFDGGKVRFGPNSNTSSMAALKIWGGANSMVLDTFASSLQFYFGGADVANIDNAGKYNRTSDERLKKNIQTIDSPLSKIALIRGVTYEWKSKAAFDMGRQLGVIAQEVEKVLPELSALQMIRQEPSL